MGKRIPSLEEMHSSQLTNILLGLILFCFLTHTIIISVLGSVTIWYIAEVDFVSFNEAVFHIRDTVKEGKHDYNTVKDSLKFNVTDVIGRVARNQEDADTFTEHMKNGLVGAASVLMEMDKIQFIHKATPLVSRMADAAVTDGARDGSIGFGKLFTMIGGLIDKEETAPMIFRGLNSTSNILERVSKSEMDDGAMSQNMVNLSGNVTALVHQFVKDNIMIEIKDASLEYKAMKSRLMKAFYAFATEEPEDDNLLN